MDDLHKTSLGYKPKYNAKSFTNIFSIRMRLLNVICRSVTIMVEMVLLLYPASLDRIMRRKIFLIHLIYLRKILIMSHIGLLEIVLLFTNIRRLKKI